MKKSEMYKAVQKVMLFHGGTLTSDERLQILRELILQEDLALYTEEQEAKQNEAV